GRVALPTVVAVVQVIPCRHNVVYQAREVAGLEVGIVDDLFLAIPYVEVVHVHRVVPELVRLENGLALTVAAEVEAEDGVVFLLKLFGQGVPVALGAVAAEFVQEHDNRRVSAFWAGIKRALDQHAVKRLERNLFKFLIVLSLCEARDGRKRARRDGDGLTTHGHTSGNSAPT